MALDTASKADIIKKFGANEKDTGSPAVQIALLSARINYLTEHLKVNKKDHASKLGMLKLVGQRRRLMRYLKKSDPSRYADVISELNIRDTNI
jgi:small subunit ribosomal protein S15